MRIFRSILAFIILALTASSCLSGGYTSSFTAIESFEYENFLTSFPDSIYVSKYYYGNTGYFLYNSYYDADTETFHGGFGVSCKKDLTLGVRYDTCNEWCAINSNSSLATSIFAVFMQGPDESKMPEHDIYFLGDESTTTWSPEMVYITNTGYVANLVSYGNDEIEPFKEGDYIKVIFTPYIGNKAQTPTEKYLAEYKGSLNLIKEWTKIDFSGLEGVRYLDISFETNREDMPLFVCLDGLVGKVTEKQLD